MLRPQVVEGFLVPCVVVKSRTQDDCYVTSVLSTGEICLLPRSSSQKKYLVGDTLWACVKEVNGWKVVLTQKDDNYVKLILNGIFSLEGTISVKAVARVSGTNFYKVSVIHSILSEPSEIIFDTIRQTRKILNSHITDTITFVPYSDDLEQYIINALLPGKPEDVKRVILWHDENRADVFVDSFKKAIFLGQKGLNAAAAAKLVKLQIRIL